jgi:hypothetical protein
MWEELKPDVTVLLLDMAQKKTAAYQAVEGLIIHLLARRAYDLVQHALSCGVEAVEEVPDMTVFDDAQYLARMEARRKEQA